MAAKSFLYQGEYAQSLLAEGRAEGEARILLKLLDGRGIALSGAQRERIESCSDAAMIEGWFDRAVVATTADEVFGDTL